MRRRRWLSAMGALLVAVGATTIGGTVPALGAPRGNGSPPAVVSTTPAVEEPAGGAGETPAARTESAPTAPAKPPAFSAAPGDGIFTLAFDAPGDGGSPITGYEYSTDGGGSWRTLSNVTGDTGKQAVISNESAGANTVPLGYNVPYNLQVRADNAVGSGAPSDTFAATIAPKSPDAPGPVSVNVADGAILLGFGSPRDYGSTITGWEYTTDNGMDWQPLTVSGSDQLTGRVTTQSTGDGTAALKPGVVYQLRLRAQSSAGAGRDSQTFGVSLPTPGAPAAPTSVVVSPTDDNGFHVDFTAPNPGDSAIAGYQYSSDDGNTWRDTATTGDGPVHATLSVNSLNGFPFGRGSTYRIRIRAVNTQGAGLPSDAAEASLPASVPGPPYNLGVVAQPTGGFALTFNPVPDNGSPITGWEYTTDSGASWRALTGITGDMQLTSTIVSESTGDGSTTLTGGTTYQIRIHARNAIGAGPDSPTVAASLPGPGSPAAPTGVSAKPAGDGFGIDFTAPDPGASAIIGYQYSTDDGNSWSDTSTTGSGSLHTDVTAASGKGYSLYPGNQYRIRIRAVNAQGAGWPSVAAEAALPPTAPGPPFDLQVDPGDQSVTLTWISSDNGSKITGYDYSTDGGTSWQPLAQVTSTDNQTVSSTIFNASTGAGQDRLQNGQSYQLLLRATNSLGTGPASGPVTVGLPMPGSPGRPTQLAGSSSGDTIGVDFVAPDPGKSAISKYQYSTDDGATWADVAAEGTSSLHVDISATSADGLALGHDDKYPIRLRAVNTQGPGLPSARTDVGLPPLKPGAPFDIMVTPGDQQVSVTATANSNGSEITKLEYSTDDGTTWQELTDITPVGDRSARVTITNVSGGGGVDRLVDGVIYQLRLRVSNDVGTGPASDAVSFTPVSQIPATVAEAPAVLVAAPANAAGKLTFPLPGNGGSAITGWEYTTDGGKTWATLPKPSGDPTLTAVITTGSGPNRPNLINDTAYQVMVRALNAIGAGAPSPAATLTPLAPPAAPTGVSVAGRTSAISVSWTAPVAGGAPVTGYTAIASPGPATCDTTTATTCVLGAESGRSYTITVVAHSASGDSSASVASATVTAAAPVIPAAPPVTNAVLATPNDNDNITPPGSTLTIRGTGYAPNSEVALVVYSAPTSLGTVVTDDHGEFSVDVVVPPTLAGNHSIAAMGADPQGNARAMRLDVVVATPTSAPTTSTPAPTTSTPITSQPSTPSPTTSAPTPPAAPTGVSVTARTSAISVSWTAPPTGGAPVTGYTAIASPGPATCTTTTATTCVLGAELDQPYTITVVAHSAGGDSPASAASASVTAADPVIPAKAPVTNALLGTPDGGGNFTPPGSMLTIRGTGYAPDSEVALVIYSSPVSLGTVVTDAHGAFSTDVVVPSTLAGDHTIAAVGADPQGNARAMRLDITVAASTPAAPPTGPAVPNPPDLPTTGPTTAPTAALGLSMFLVGAALVGAVGLGRRRARRRDAR